MIYIFNNQKFITRGIAEKVPPLLQIVLLEISKGNNSLFVKNCYYLDRVKGGEYYSSPKKFVTRNFCFNEILEIVSSELDRKYFGVEITDKFADLDRDEFITTMLKNIQIKYNFLIFIGEGCLVNGIPSIIKTRFKNRIYRSIYIEMHCNNGKGVVTDCHYFDRKYKERRKVVPETLSLYFLSITGKPY